MDFSWQVIVTVFTLGGIGAVVRALVLNILGIVSLFYFPLGVLFINMLACFLGGFIIAMLLPEKQQSRCRSWTPLPPIIPKKSCCI